MGFDFTISRPETHGSGNSAVKASVTIAENFGNAGYGDTAAFVWIPHLCKVYDYGNFESMSLGNPWCAWFYGWPISLKTFHNFEV